MLSLSSHHVELLKAAAGSEGGLAVMEMNNGVTIIKQAVGTTAFDTAAHASAFRDLLGAGVFRPTRGVLYELTPHGREMAKPS